MNDRRRNRNIDPFGRTTSIGYFFNKIQMDIYFVESTFQSILSMSLGLTSKST